MTGNIKIKKITNEISSIIIDEQKTYNSLSFQNLNDLLKALKINVDDPYIMNYLAYSWLERNYKIEEAMTMLKKAYNQKKKKPYIIDSN